MKQNERVIPIYTTQNADRAITSKDYNRADLQDKLLVTSIFRTHQGEGMYAGTPAIFLRLAGCNYGAKDSNCLWCDTAFEYDKGRAMSYDEIIAEARSLVQDNDLAGGHNILGRRYILVITGGEPTLQHNLIPFIEKIQASYVFQNVMIETNGSQASFFNALEDSHASPFICVSPKASYKAGRYAKLSQVVLDRANELKFVLDADPDSPHHTVPDWALEQRLSRTVMVSPMAHYAKPYKGEVSSIWTPGLFDKKRTAANYEYAARYALENHLTISIQQHLFLGIA